MTLPLRSKVCVTITILLAFSFGAAKADGRKDCDTATPLALLDLNARKAELVSVIQEADRAQSSNPSVREAQERTIRAAKEDLLEISFQIDCLSYQSVDVGIA